MAVKTVAEKISALETKLDELYAQSMTLSIVVYGPDGNRKDWAPDRVETALRLQRLQAQAERVEARLNRLYAQQ